MSKRKSVWDADLFDASDVTWEVLESKRRDRVTIVLHSEEPFNLTKTYLALKLLTEKIELELNILDEADGEH